MASGRSVYVAKRAATLVNPITNDSIFLQNENSSFAAFVSAYDGGLVGGTSNLDGKMIYIRASGKFTTGTTSTLVGSLYYSPTAKTSLTFNGTGVTALLGSAMMTTGSLASSNGNWFIEATLIWDFTSKLMNGYYDSGSSVTPTFTTAAVTSSITAVDLSVPGGGFMAGVHFGSTNASNVATLSEFVLEVM